MKILENWGVLLGVDPKTGNTVARLVGTPEDQTKAVTTSPIIHLHEPRGGGDVFPYVVTRSGSEYSLKGMAGQGGTPEEWLDLIRRVLGG